MSCGRPAALLLAISCCLPMIGTRMPSMDAVFRLPAASSNATPSICRFSAERRLSGRCFLAPRSLRRLSPPTARRTPLMPPGLERRSPANSAPRCRCRLWLAAIREMRAHRLRRPCSQLRVRTTRTTCRGSRDSASRSPRNAQASSASCHIIARRSDAVARFESVSTRCSESLEIRTSILRSRMVRFYHDTAICSRLGATSRIGRLRQNCTCRAIRQALAGRWRS